LVYNGHAIGIAIGITSAKVNEAGVVTTDKITGMKRHSVWSNPLDIARDYKEMIENGMTKAEIAKLMGISRARVVQVMDLLKLHPDIQRYLNRAKDDPNALLFTERKLREIAKIQDHDEQIIAFKELIS